MKALPRITRRHAILGAALAATGLGAAREARADVAPLPRIRRPPRRLSLQLVSVTVRASDAPASDADFVRREAANALAEQGDRIHRCLRGVELREDPLRRRERTIDGTLTFDRGRRPRLSLGRGRGVPAAARACVAEAARAIAVRTVPHGRVVVAFRYRLA